MRADRWYDKEMDLLDEDLREGFITQKEYNLSVAELNAEMAQLEHQQKYQEMIDGATDSDHYPW